MHTQACHCGESHASTVGSRGAGSGPGNAKNQYEEQVHLDKDGAVHKRLVPVLCQLAEPTPRAVHKVLHGSVIRVRKWLQFLNQPLIEPGFDELLVPINRLQRDSSLQTVLYRAISCKYVAAAPHAAAVAGEVAGWEEGERQGEG